MVIGQLFLVYPCRHTWMRPLSNPYLHGAVIAGAATQLAAASLPFTAELLGDAGIPLELWAVVIGGALLSWALAEGYSRFTWRQHQW